MANVTKHILPAVKERETVLLLNPRAHVVSRELVLWEEPRANRARARQRDMVTEEGGQTRGWQAERRTGQATLGHTLNELAQSGPQRIVMTSSGEPSRCLTKIGNYSIDWKCFYRKGLSSASYHSDNKYQIRWWSYLYNSIFSLNRFIILMKF